MTDLLKPLSPLLIALTLALPTPCLAWFCDDDASEKAGNTYRICGLGQSADEQVARENALSNAFKEFDKLCWRSSMCAGRPTEVTPKRCECKKLGAEFECRRMIEVTVSESKGKSGSVETSAKKEAVLFVGQSRDDLLKQAGYPSQMLDATTDGTSKTQIFYYRSESLCSGQTCSIVLRNNRVERFSNVRLTLTDELNQKSKTFFERVGEALGF